MRSARAAIASAQHGTAKCSEGRPLLACRAPARSVIWAAPEMAANIRHHVDCVRSLNSVAMREAKPQGAQSGHSYDAAAMLADRGSLMHRYLDPATSLAEILFGLIMTLTFTLGAGIIIEDEGRAGARELLIAVIGCNVAWGIIDGALFLVGELFDRGRLRRLGRALRMAPDDTAAVRLVAAEMDPLVSGLLTTRESEVLYRRIVANVATKPETANSIRREDWLGAGVSFVLVVISSIPAAIPFVVIDDARLALRVSNAVLVALLFFTGYWWARYTVGKAWLAGLAFLVVGLALVAAAIALGG
jgi:VIT family